ncbi:RIT1 protein, partial [Polypterus senegalus]
EDAYKTQIRIDDEPANLDILDTAGQAEFTAMRDQYMRAGEGFIISYSITDRRSFHEAREFKQLIHRVRRTVDTPVVLVGNKSDLVHLRQVSTDEGRGLAREFSCPFFETSAALRHYIDDVFIALVRQIRQRDKEAVLALERKNRKHASSVSDVFLERSDFFAAHLDTRPSSKSLHLTVHSHLHAAIPEQALH